MKKLIAAEPDKVVVAEVEAPVIAADEVLVRAVRSLVSPGSELNRVRRLPDDTDGKWPNHDLGYAMCGEVVEVGAEVTGLKPGDRVATMQHHQELVASPTGPDHLKPTLRIPDGITWDQAPFILWGRSCYNWTMKADIKPGETVAVMGLGLVGLLMTMWAKLRGPGKVIGIDLHEGRLELGRKAGCDVLVNAGERSSVEAVKELTGGKGADCTLHCAAGPHVEAFEHSQLMTRERGRIVLIGIHSRPLTVLRGQFLWKDLLGGCTDYDMDHDLFMIGAELIANGSLPVLDIVTHNVSFTEAPGVYDMLNRRGHEAGAVLLRWGEGGEGKP
jgi:threonine dehydrogenase-like Zn-dependent dehydrogenase